MAHRRAARGNSFNLIDAEFTMRMNKLIPQLPYLAIITVLAVLVGTNVFANRNLANNSGMPAELLEELYTIQEQVVQLTADVQDLRQLYIDSTSTVGDVTGSLCFNVSLGVSGNAGIGANGTIKAGLATGVDIYGLIDVDAGGELAANANVNVGLNASGNVVGVVCMNTGILKLQADGTLISPFGELNLAGTHEHVGTTVNSFAQHGGTVRNGMVQLAQTADTTTEHMPRAVALVGDTATSAGDTSTAALDTNRYVDTLAELPGGRHTVNHVAGVFDSLSDGNVCDTLSAGGFSQIDGRVFSFLGSVCSAVPSTFHDGVEAASGFAATAVTTLSNITRAADFAELAVSRIQGVVEPVLNGINSAVSTVKGIADKICDNLPGC